MSTASNTPTPPASGGLTGRDRASIGAAALLSGAVVGSEFLGAAEPVIFTISALTLVLLAWLLGHATEQLGLHVGGRIAGLLNATLGNLPELVVVLLLIHAATDSNDLLDVARASILGSVLGNVLFVLGLAFLIGGLKHGTQVFTRTFASLQSTMLVLAVAAISVPTIIAARGASSSAANHVEGISVACAIVLLIVYACSIRYFITDPDHVAVDHSGVGWNKALSIRVLIGCAIAVGVVSEAMVKSMEQTIHSVGISAAFMGFILVPIVGNVAEHLVAVQLARRNDMDFALSIALGSSVQVALGLAPIAVLASYPLGNPLSLVFEPLQLVALVLTAVIVPTVVSDGESTWIEGLQLIAVYALIAIGFWY